MTARRMVTKEKKGNFFPFNELKTDGVGDHTILTVVRRTLYNDTTLSTQLLIYVSLLY